MSDLGGLTLVPYGLPGPNGDTKLLIWPLPLIYVRTAKTQVIDAWYYHHSLCKIRIGSPYSAWQSLRSFTGSGLGCALEYIWCHYSLAMFYIWTQNRSSWYCCVLTPDLLYYLFANMNVNMIHTCSSSRNITKNDNGWIQNKYSQI